MLVTSPLYVIIQSLRLGGMGVLMKLMECPVESSNICGPKILLFLFDRLVLV